MEGKASALLTETAKLFPACVANIPKAWRAVNKDPIRKKNIPNTKKEGSPSSRTASGRTGPEISF
jgi:hypothetical protein